MTKFYEWETDYQNYRRHTPKRERLDYVTFMQRRIREMMEARLPTQRLWAEAVWLKCGSPYYNVHPELVEQLMKVDLSKIPSPLFQMPHGLECVNIRMDQKHEQFVLREDHLTDILIHFESGALQGKAPSGSHLHGILMCDVKSPDEKGKRGLLFVIDFGVYTEFRQPVYNMFMIECEEGKSLEQAIAEVLRSYRSESYAEMMSNVMRLCVTIGFLSTNPTICEPDILVADRGEFQMAKSDDERDRIAKRARVKGKYGYNIGTDLMFIGKRKAFSEKREGELTGRELEYAHIRGGHPHAVRYGPKKELVKIMWYVPTTVRPDLPFKKEEDK